MLRLKAGRSGGRSSSLNSSELNWYNEKFQDSSDEEAMETFTEVDEEVLKYL